MYHKSIWTTVVAAKHAEAKIILLQGIKYAEDHDCPNEKAPQIHQAWLLTDSDIAIYEQRATEFNDAVVQSMQLLR